MCVPASELSTNHLTENVMTDVESASRRSAAARVQTQQRFLVGLGKSTQEGLVGGQRHRKAKPFYRAKCSKELGSRVLYRRYDV